MVSDKPARTIQFPPTLVLTAALLTLVLPCAAQNSAPDWQAQVREHVAAKQFVAALELVERRLADAPRDLEAHGWRARLLAWSERWKDAETEYRTVLEAHPDDTDILLGLSDVLHWQQRSEESLAVLERARQIEPRRADVHLRRGRVLRALGRTEESREAYREALRLDPASADARAGLSSLDPEPRHELRIGGDFDHFPFAEDAQSVTASLRSRWNSQWTTSVTGNFQHRFGQDAGRFLGSVTYHLTRSDALTLGGAAADDKGVIPKGEAFFEYGHGWRIERQSFVRGVEAGYHQHWFWFRQARILALTPSVVFYLPRDWSWSLGITAARSRFPATAAEWRPSGSTRLNFPLAQRWSGHVFFAVGTENFAQADQIGRFSARTYGGGARFQITSRQEAGGYVFYQDRSQGRTQTGFGSGYALRF